MQPQTITIALPAHLLPALLGLLDAGLKATGLRGARDAAALLDVIEAAAKAADAPSATQTPPAQT